MNLNPSIKLTCVWLSATTLLAVASIHASTPAFVLGDVSANPPSSFTGTRGWQFKIGQDIFITQLGVFDSGGDGLINLHQIGLWRQGSLNPLSGTLLSSVTVPAGTDSPLIGGYRWASIDPVFLPGGLDDYVIAAQYSSGDMDALVAPSPGSQGEFHFASGIIPSTTHGRLGLGSDLPYPLFGTTSPCAECPGERFWEPNFQFEVVPEPSVWLLIALSSSILFMRRRMNS